MFNFADADFYTEQYLMGRQPVIPITEFNFWATEATQRINRHNLPVEELQYIVDSIQLDTLGRLQRCTCRIAEILYADETSRGMPNQPVKRSESVGGYSVSYADQTRPQDVIERGIQGVINKWLSGGELHNEFIYRGV